MDSIVLSLEGEQWRFMSLSVTWACGRFLNKTQPKSAEGSCCLWDFLPSSLFGEGEVSGKRNSFFSCKAAQGKVVVKYCFGHVCCLHLFCL